MMRDTRGTLMVARSLSHARLGDNLLQPRHVQPEDQLPSVESTGLSRHRLRIDRSYQERALADT